LSSFFSFAFQKSTVFRGLKLAVFVGTALNIINQGDMILILEWTKINYFKVGLTYVVPYLVSTYSTASALVAVRKIENPHALELPS
jgi:hypothetical protein